MIQDTARFRYGCVFSLTKEIIILTVITHKILSWYTQLEHFAIINKSKPTKDGPTIQKYTTFHAVIFCSRKMEVEIILETILWYLYIGPKRDYLCKLKAKFQMKKIG